MCWPKMSTPIKKKEISQNVDKKYVLKKNKKQKKCNSVDYGPYTNYNLNSSSLCPQQIISGPLRILGCNEVTCFGQ